MNMKTKRCIIRNFQAEDISTFMEYRNDAKWMKHQGYKCRTKEEYKRDLLKDTPLYEGNQFALINIKANKLIGDIYLKQEDDFYWIGYTIHPLYTRQGYAKEAILAIIEWASKCGGVKIKAGVESENIASIKLLESLNFSYQAPENDELVYCYDLI